MSTDPIVIAGVGCTPARRMMRRSTAESRGLAPLATVIAHATHSQEPAWFTRDPVGALREHGLEGAVASLCIDGGEAIAMAIECA